MEIEAIGRHLDRLDGVRRRESSGRTGWYLDGRLVARVEDEETLLIRSDFADREHLVDAHPETFYVTPRAAAHQKVMADLRRGDPGAILEALDAAWYLQRR